VAGSESYRAFQSTESAGGGPLNLDGDAARDQRYRDLRSGFILDGFRYKSDQRRWLFSASADHVGYRDQQYLVRFVQAGKAKASFEVE